MDRARRARGAATYRSGAHLDTRRPIRRLVWQQRVGTGLRPAFPAPRDAHSPSSGGESGEPDRTRIAQSDISRGALARRPARPRVQRRSRAARRAGRAVDRESRHARAGGRPGAAPARDGWSRPRGARASGDRLEDDWPSRWGFVADRVRGKHLGAGAPGRLVVTRVDLREDLVGGDCVAALLEAADADGVIDALLFGASPGTEPERSHADRDRADRADEAARL